MICVLLLQGREAGIIKETAVNYTTVLKKIMGLTPFCVKENNGSDPVLLDPVLLTPFCIHLYFKGILVRFPGLVYSVDEQTICHRRFCSLW